MITLKIIESPNVTNLGEVSINLPNITIGRQLKNTIVIQDPSLSNQVINLTLSKKGLTLNSDGFIKINGKKIKGKIKLKPGHTFSAGKTKILVVSITLDSLPNEDQYFRDLEAMSIEHRESFAIVEAMELEYAVELGKIDELER